MKPVRTALSVLACSAAFAAAQDAVPRHDEISRLVRQEQELANVPFPEVIRAATGHTVIPVDPKADAALLAGVTEAIARTITALNNPEHPIHRAARINEASRFVEDQLRAELNKVPGWSCDIPRNAAGEAQRSGYPDLVVTLPDGSTVYLDPKLVSAGQADSTLRTFYYQPRTDTGKVTRDARHLLVGFRHNAAIGPGLRLESWKMVDLSRLRVRLKAEFQAGNDRIYTDANVIANGSVQPDGD